MADAEPSDELDAALVERFLTAVGEKIGCPWADVPESERAETREIGIVGILSLGIPAAALNALWRGEAVVVPKEPTREMLNALWVAKVPDDWQAGQRAQSKLGADRVPPSYIAEETWGQYERALAASPFAAKE